MARPKSQKRRKIIIFSTIFLLVVGLSTVAFLKRKEVIIPVQTEKVTRRNLTELVVANGKIQPVVQVKISPEVSGEIIELPVVEGQQVKKGDLLLRIKPDAYVAARNSEKARYQSSEANRNLAEANLQKAEREFHRNEELYKNKLLSEAAFLEFKTAFDVARASYEVAVHQVAMENAALARSEEELSKTTIYSPISGTVTKLNSQLGERVVGTAMMTGTEVMIVSDLNAMEARVDVGEIDVVLIAVGQKARLEVDAFRDQKFKGVVTEIANSSKNFNPASNQQQEATRFEVRIKILEKENFRPGMSVTAEVETRYRTNVLTVPIQCVTTRLPKDIGKQAKAGGTNAPGTHVAAADTNQTAGTNASGKTEGMAAAGSSKSDETKARKPGEKPKPVEVVFVLDSDRVKAVPVERGISDDNYVEIVKGLKEGQEVVSGGFKAISNDLADGTRIRKNNNAAAGERRPNAT